MEVYTGNRDFRLFCTHDLDIDPMTFIDELDPYSQEIHGMCENELRIDEGFRADRQTDRQSQPKSYTNPFRGWSKTVSQVAWNDSRSIFSQCCKERQQRR